MRARVAQGEGYQGRAPWAGRRRGRRRQAAGAAVLPAVRAEG